MTEKKTKTRRTAKEIALGRIDLLEKFLADARDERVVAAAKAPGGSADREQRRYEAAAKSLADCHLYVELDLELKDDKKKTERKAPSSKDDAES